MRELLARALETYPDTFAGLELPEDASTFRARYPELLPRFEALRVSSPERAEIARFLCLEAEARTRFVEPDGEAERSLEALFAEPTEPLSLVRVDLPGPRRLTPSADYDGRLYVGTELATLAEELDRARLVTKAAAGALAYIAQQTAQPEGVSLAGKRFVLFGAGAELSPVYTLLAAGAEVLWIDRESPPIDRLLEPRLGGALYYVSGGVDLLTMPGAVRATVLAFARGEPLHLAMYACASGAAREVRLALTVNALVRSLPAGTAASLAYLLSPMSVSLIEPEDAALADQRQQSASTMQRTLLRTGPLHPGHVTLSERVSSAVVSQQGASFQLAEYVGKRLAAEAFFEFGGTLAEPGPGTLAVSANMAPVTATRSLTTPLLAAAAPGAPSVDIVIAKPSTARAISALLTVHDAVAPSLSPRALAERRPSERLRTLFSRQFHGGVHAQPYALDGLVRLAALRGIAQQPKLALGLLR